MILCVYFKNFSNVFMHFKNNVHVKYFEIIAIIILIFAEEEEENEGNEVEIVGSTLCSPVGAIGFEDGGETVGRVLVCDADYRWKTVCSVGFDEREAKVICSSLGLSTESKSLKFKPYNNE